VIDVASERRNPMLQSSGDEDAADPPSEDQITDEPVAQERLEARRFKRLRRNRLLSRFSIQSKLVLMMVLCAIIAAAVVGLIAFQAGRSSLRTQVFNRLTEVRESQSRALESEFKDLKNSLVLYSHGAIAVPALQTFIAGFDQLADATINPAQQQSIADYYNDTFMKDIEQYSNAKPDLNAVLPATNAQKYLQAIYTAQRKSDDVAIMRDDAHDGSAWSAANARYQDFFRQIVQRFEFQDVLLLDTRGNVVYTAYKDVDLGTNILTGPYNTSLLRGAYEKALASNSDDYVGITDFEIYQPAEGQPTAWMVSPVSANGRTEGVMALQFPITKINRLMTFGKQWAASGMGATGETFLAGPDDLMRSDSRLILENPGQYKHDVMRAGTPPDIADTAIRLGMTCLIQPVGGEATRAGLDRLQAELTSEESQSIINELARQIDAAAEELGVEPIRTVHNGYLASCGLNVPRLDNVRRTVDFALEAQRIIERFNAETGRHLSLRAGIDTGRVSSGLVGRSSIVYDMWGAAVNLAYRVQSGSLQDGIYVTQRVYETMGDTEAFTPAGSLTMDGVEQPIWRVLERSG